MFNSLLLSFFESSISRITTAIILLLVVGTVIFFLIKSSGFRVFFCYFLSFLLICGGVFSGFQLNKYYNTTGGVIGQISGFFNPNLVSVSTADKDISFDFSNVMLTKYNDTTYRAEFSSNDSIVLGVNEGYVVYVNDTPCELIEYGEDYTSDEISSDYVISEYYYAFYNEYQEYVLKDKLSLRFAFYKDSTRLIVETYGGEHAVSLWNSYFQKNNLVVRIAASNDVYISSYATIDLKVNDLLINSVKVKKGSTFVLPEYEIKGYRLMGWSLDSQTLIDSKYIVVVENLEITGILEKTYEVDFLRYEYTDDSADYNSCLFARRNYILGEYLSELVPANTPTKPGFDFVGWSLDGENVIDLTITQFIEDIEYLLPVWESNELLLNVNLNGGSTSIDGVSYTSNFTYLANTNDVIYFTEPVLSGKVFEAYYVELSQNSSYNFICYDSTFSMSFNDIYYNFFVLGQENTYNPNLTEELKNFNSINISVCYLPESINIDSWTDEELCQMLTKVYSQNEFCDYELPYISTSSRDLICLPYISNMRDEPTEFSNYEVMQQTIELFEFDVEINESMTDRDFLEILYNEFSNLVEE